MNEVVFQELEEVSRTGWDQLVPVSATALYNSPEWHQEMGAMTGAVCQAAASYVDGKLITLVPAYHFPTGSANPLLNPVQLFDPAHQVASANEWGAQTLLGTASGYATSPLSHSIADWLEVAQLAATAYSGSVAVMYLADIDAQQLAGALPGVPMLLTGLRSILPVHGATLSEHLATLLSKKRYQVRKEMRRLELGGRVITTARLADVDLVSLSNLQMNTQRRHNAVGSAEFFQSYFQQIIASEGSYESVVFQCWHGKQLIGFNLCLRYRDTLTVRTIGLDYDHIGEHYEYPNLLTHAPLCYAIDHGLRVIDLGIGAASAKLRRTAEPVLLWTLLIRSPAGWSPVDTVRHNSAQASAWLGELAALLGPAVIAQLVAIRDP